MPRSIPLSLTIQDGDQSIGQRYVSRAVRDLSRPGLADPDRSVHILLYRRLVDVVASMPAGDAVLDYGCGLRPYRPLFTSRFRRYIGADLKGNQLADVTIAADGSLPIPDASVDAVLSSQVLEHVPDPAAYLAEAHRVLHVGGRLILSTHGFWVYHPDPTDYWRWTADGLRLMVARAGFQIERMESICGLLSVVLQLFLLATQHRLPSALRVPFVAFIQAAIGMIERRRRGAFSNNAMDYLLVAVRN